MIVIEHSAKLSILVPGRDAELGQGAETRQSLASEPERLHGGEIRELAELGGGVLDSEPGKVSLLYPVSIVTDLDHLGSLAQEPDLNIGGSSVQAVLQQLLDPSGEAEHHLARADLVNYAPGDLLDASSSSCGHLNILLLNIIFHDHTYL